MPFLTPPACAFANRPSPPSGCAPLCKAKRAPPMAPRLIQPRRRSPSPCPKVCAGRRHCPPGRAWAWCWPAWWAPPWPCWVGVPASHPFNTVPAACTAPKHWSAAACWPPQAIAWCATPRPAACPTRGAAPSTRRLAPSTPPTSRPTRCTVLGSGRSARFNAPCAKASRAMGGTCTRRFRSHRLPR